MWFASSLTLTFFDRCTKSYICCLWHNNASADQISQVLTSLYVWKRSSSIPSFTLPSSHGVPHKSYSKFQSHSRHKSAYNWPERAFFWCLILYPYLIRALQTDWKVNYSTACQTCQVYCPIYSIILQYVRVVGMIAFRRLIRKYQGLLQSLRFPDDLGGGNASLLAFKLRSCSFRESFANFVCFHISCVQQCCQVSFRRSQSTQTRLKRRRRKRRSLLLRKRKKLPRSPHKRKKKRRKTQKMYVHPVFSLYIWYWLSLVGLPRHKGRLRKFESLLGAHKTLPTLPGQNALGYMDDRSYSTLPFIFTGESPGWRGIQGRGLCWGTVRKSHTPQFLILTFPVDSCAFSWYLVLLRNTTNLYTLASRL